MGNSFGGLPRNDLQGAYMPDSCATSLAQGLLVVKLWLEPLLGKDWLENIVQTRIPNPDERWTHYYDKGKEYRQLDYILLSKALARAPGNEDARPEIERRGLPRRAAKAGVRRFRGVGHDRPKASDHCPVVIEIRL